MKAKWRKWTVEELQYLKDSYGTLPCLEIASHVSRSVDAVHGTAEYLGLNCWKQFPPAKSPEELTTDVAYILGVLCGDGHISTRMVLADCNLDFVLAFQRAVENAFGLLYRVRTYQHHIHFEGKKDWAGTRYEVSIRQKRILDYVKSLGTFGVRTWNIPKSVLTGSNEIKYAYLRGFFDSEGSVHISRKGKSDFAAIELGVVNPNLYAIMELLSLLGIHSNVKVYKAKGTLFYRLAITDLFSLVTYAQTIGFNIPQKMRKLVSHLRLPKTGPYSVIHYLRELRADGIIESFGEKPQKWRLAETKNVAET